MGKKISEGIKKHYSLKPRVKVKKEPRVWETEEYKEQRELFELNNPVCAICGGSEELEIKRGIYLKDLDPESKEWFSEDNTYRCCYECQRQRSIDALHKVKNTL